MFFTSKFSLPLPAPPLLQQHAAAGAAPASYHDVAARLLQADVNKDGALSQQEYEELARCKAEAGGRCADKVYQDM